jgi:hypothetical protein
VFKDSQVRAFLLYNHWCFDINRSMMDFLETAGKFIGNRCKIVSQPDCGIVATGTGQIQRFQMCFRERRFMWLYMSVVHRFQHGVLSCLKNINILSAEGHLISAGLKILPKSWVGIYLQLSAGWNRCWVTDLLKLWVHRLLWIRKLYYRVHKNPPVVLCWALWMKFTRSESCTLWSTPTL